VSSQPVPLALARCMAKDPAERFASTQTVLEALSELGSDGAGVEGASAARRG
jgi:hypothetical protein